MSSGAPVLNGLIGTMCSNYYVNVTDGMSQHFMCQPGTAFDGSFCIDEKFCRGEETLGFRAFLEVLYTLYSVIDSLLTTQNNGTVIDSLLTTQNNGYVDATFVAVMYVLSIGHGAFVAAILAIAVWMKRIDRPFLKYMITSVAGILFVMEIMTGYRLITDIFDNRIQDVAAKSILILFGTFACALKLLLWYDAQKYKLKMVEFSKMNTYEQIFHVMIKRKGFERQVKAYVVIYKLIYSEPDQRQLLLEQLQDGHQDCSDGACCELDGPETEYDNVYEQFKKKLIKKIPSFDRTGAFLKSFTLHKAYRSGNTWHLEEYPRISFAFPLPRE